MPMTPLAHAIQWSATESDGATDKLKALHARVSSAFCMFLVLGFRLFCNNFRWYELRRREFEIDCTAATERNETNYLLTVC